MNHIDPNADHQRPAKFLNAIKAREWKLRLLTGTAFALGLVSIVAGIALAWSYFVDLDPKLRELQAGYAAYEAASLTNAMNPPAHLGLTPAPAERYRASRDQMHMAMTRVLGRESMLIAASVALVGAGALLTVVLVALTRRTTLRQINSSLAEISEQLRQMQGRLE